MRPYNMDVTGAMIYLVRGFDVVVANHMSRYINGHAIESHLAHTGELI